MNITVSIFFPFLHLSLTPSGYAHLRFAGASLSQSEKVKAGANTAKRM